MLDVTAGLLSRLPMTTSVCPIASVVLDCRHGAGDDERPGRGIAPEPHRPPNDLVVALRVIQGAAGALGFQLGHGLLRLAEPE